MILLCAALLLPASATARQSDAPVRILLDQPPRAVEYQLGRLTNDELARIERRDDDAKYRLVYVALLTRRGLARGLRDEAVAALAKLDTVTPTQILLDTLAKIPPDDDSTANALAAMLMAQPVETLQSQRDLLAGATTSVGTPSPALRAAYGGLMIADASPRAAWQTASEQGGHLVELIRGVPLLPEAESFDPLRAQLIRSIATVIVSPPPAGDGDAQVAAVSALLRLPESTLPPNEVERLTSVLTATVADTPVERRTEPASIDAIRLAEKLVARLPEPARARPMRELRALGVQVITVEAVPEQMRFNLNWFVVEAGKPVQIVLANPDNMPHNLVLGKPDSLETLGTAAMTMSMPADPSVKPYVPPGPLVVAATGLVNAGGMERLNFTAPAAAGEYVYACTFPGHWVRMYGVMLVVDNLDAWEAAPTVPTDPMTKQPLASR